MRQMKDLTLNERWVMMLPVLQDRYGLKFHRETRDLQVYTLVVAKGGSKLRPSKRTRRIEGGLGRAMMRLSGEGMSLDAHGASMDSLAHMISQQLGSTVIDKTGLTGKYEYNLEMGTGPERVRGFDVADPQEPDHREGVQAEAPASERNRHSLRRCRNSLA